jgi:hypothetical protein
VGCGMWDVGDGLRRQDRNAIESFDVFTNGEDEVGTMTTTLSLRATPRSIV